MKYEKLVKMFNSTLKMRETILSIYIYKIETFETPTIFHVSTILKTFETPTIFHVSTILKN